MIEFEKGFIDAAEFSIPSWDLWLGLQKVAKYNYYPGWYQPTTIHELIINKKNGMVLVQQLNSSSLLHVKVY